MSWLLNFCLALPLAAALFLLLIPGNRHRLIRCYTLAVTLLVFLVSLGLAARFDRSSAGFQFETNTLWLASPAIRYHVAIDGLALWLVILTTFLSFLAVLVSWRHIDRRVKEFHLFLLLMEFGLVGVFVALDLFLFYVFWEVSLVPMYFLIGIWGHERRIYAAIKFFLFTMAGSVLMLAAFIYLYNLSGTFDFPALAQLLASRKISFSPLEETLLFLAFFIAFAIKVPLFPLHTWLPDAHVEAPTAGSVILASVMLKMGTYGLVRFCLPLFPTACREHASVVVSLALIGIIYGALVAMVQPNMKKLVAYSSVSHLGFVVLGIFSFNQIALDGAVYQMLNHGISTGALFILVGYLYERTHSLQISSYGGVAAAAPGLAAVFLITSLASLGLPALNNFVGEFLVLQGVALTNFRWAALAALGVVLSACYLLWLYQRAFLGQLRSELRSVLRDLTPREWSVVVPLVILMVWMGVGSRFFLGPITVTNAYILERSQRGVVYHVWNALDSAPVEVSRAR